MQKLSVGSTVILKSGGPIMTVNHLRDGNEVTCVWFKDGKDLQNGVFKIETLEAWEDAVEA